MKNLSNQETATLRTAFAATLAALQRGRVPVGVELQRLLKASWDIVREPGDPALAFQAKATASPILLPFGPGMQ